MGPPASDRVSRVRSYSGSTLLLVNFVYGTFTFFGLPFQTYSTINNGYILSVRNPDSKLSVWPLSLSLAATQKIDFSFSSCRYLDVSVHDVPSYALWIHSQVTVVLTAGFPHSDTHGSLTVCVSPWPFAAFRVLLRFLMPRHSPFALISLTFDIYE